MSVQELFPRLILARPKWYSLAMPIKNRTINVWVYFKYVWNPWKKYGYCWNVIFYQKWKKENIILVSCYSRSMLRLPNQRLRPISYHIFLCNVSISLLSIWIQCSISNCRSFGIARDGIRDSDWSMGRNQLADWPAFLCLTVCFAPFLWVG